jgi:uncharacterized protein (TIGR03792 family)
VVVEWLTFEVPLDLRDVWLALEKSPGFVRKQMWVEEGDVRLVHAVIWWESRELWKRITPAQVDEVDRRMGDLWRNCTMRVYDVVRDC